MCAARGQFCAKPVNANVPGTCSQILRREQLHCAAIQRIPELHHARGVGKRCVVGNTGHAGNQARLLISRDLDGADNATAAFPDSP